MDKEFYYKRLYPFQEAVLRCINRLQTGFYLSGGTAASRVYLGHRFSDDLDLFVNDRSEFALWVDRVFDALGRYPEGQLDVLLRENRFARCGLVCEDLTLKLELINDVPSHIGQIQDHASLGRVDSAENILANKITALMDRNEPKDIADVWGFCVRKGLSIRQALEDVGSRAAGIFPLDVARALYQETKKTFGGLNGLRLRLWPDLYQK